MELQNFFRVESELERSRIFFSRRVRVESYNFVRVESEFEWSRKIFLRRI